MKNKVLPVIIGLAIAAGLVVAARLFGVDGVFGDEMKNYDTGEKAGLFIAIALYAFALLYFMERIRGEDKPSRSPARRTTEISER